MWLLRAPVVFGTFESKHHDFAGASFAEIPKHSLTKNLPLASEEEVPTTFTLIRATTLDTMVLMVKVKVIMTYEETSTHVLPRSSLGMTSLKAC
jgi:hypothetical protein